MTSQSLIHGPPLGEELGRKSVQLDELDSRISDVDGNTTGTLSSLDSLKEKLNTFKEETKRLTNY